jgi:hypothetical protein
LQPKLTPTRSQLPIPLISQPAQSYLSYFHRCFLSLFFCLAVILRANPGPGRDPILFLCARHLVASVCMPPSTRAPPIVPLCARHAALNGFFLISHASCWSTCMQNYTPPPPALHPCMRHACMPSTHNQVAPPLLLACTVLVCHLFIGCLLICHVVLMLCLRDPVLGALPSSLASAFEMCS